MSLKEKLQRLTEGSRPSRRLFETYGFLNNPFPAANQTSGHPRRETSADDMIARLIDGFTKSGYASEAIIILGTQGTGKTNLLNYYQEQIQDAFQRDEAFYIIRYYPDPEPEFDSVVKKVFTSLGDHHLKQIVQKLHNLTDDARRKVLGRINNAEFKSAMQKISVEDPAHFSERASLLLEWLNGLRPFNRHKLALGVNSRLDTVEARIQSLRDLVKLGSSLGLLKGIFLLLDELEKQDNALPKSSVVRYLSSIRALVDALPCNLFMMLAMTPTAWEKYRILLPAMGGRLQRTIVLKPLDSAAEAVGISSFYQEDARDKIRRSDQVANWRQGKSDLISDKEAALAFSEAAAERSSAVEGVTHRGFLHKLHELAEGKLSAAS